MKNGPDFIVPTEQQDFQIDSLAENIEKIIISSLRDKLKNDAGQMDKTLFVGTLVELIIRLHHGLKTLEKTVYEQLLTCAYNNLGEE